MSTYLVLSLLIVQLATVAVGWRIADLTIRFLLGLGIVCSLVLLISPVTK